MAVHLVKRQERGRVRTMTQSFRSMEKVEIDAVNERCERVQTLSETENESYQLVKDRLTGEHYLMYVCGDVRHLMPLEYDDVISMALGEQDYQYPEHWNKPFLRTGDHSYFVWFDPVGAEELEESEWLAEQIRARLAAFKQKGKVDLDETRKFLEELDQLSRENSQSSE